MSVPQRQKLFKNVILIHFIAVTSPWAYNDVKTTKQKCFYCKHRIKNSWCINPYELYNTDFYLFIIVIFLHIYVVQKRSSKESICACIHRHNLKFVSNMQIKISHISSETLFIYFLVFSWFWFWFLIFPSIHLIM